MGEVNAFVEIGKLVAGLLTAALAAFLALLANRFLDKKRAKRELLAEIAKDLRSDVREAVLAASRYWSTDTVDKLETESRIKMLEHEIRAAAVLLDQKTNDKSGEFQSSLTNFLAVVTGADFESADLKANSAHVRDVVGAGVALRKATAELRRSQISAGH